MKISKKILAIFISIIMLLSLSSPVFAASRTSGSHSSSTHRITTKSYSSKSSAKSYSSKSSSKSYSSKSTSHSYKRRSTTRKKSSSHSSVVHYKNGHVARNVPTSVKRMLKENAGVGANSPNYIIDHVVALENGGTNDISNLEVLSKSQHAIKTKRDNALRRSREGK